MKNKAVYGDLAIWGTPPPPFGGMTVHISRLLPVLRQENVSYVLYTFRKIRIHDENAIYVYSIKWFWRICFGRVEDIHYVLTQRTWVRFLAVLFGIIRNRKIIIRIGGASLNKSLNKSIITRLMSRFVVKHAASVIAVNQKISNLAIQMGADRKKVYSIPGFIPPNINGKTLNRNIEKFLRDKWPKLITTGLIVNPQSRDIYGIYKTYDIFKNILHDYPKSSLIVFTQNRPGCYSEEIKIFRNKIKNEGLENTILLYSGSDEFLKAMKCSDIFLRPTLSDGDANSIREALYLGVPVVASDCVDRPDGVRLFPTVDAEQYYSTLVDTIINLEKVKNDIKRIDMKDNTVPLLSLIKSLKQSAV